MPRLGRGAVLDDDVAHRLVVAEQGGGAGDAVAEAFEHNANGDGGVGGLGRDRHLGVGGTVGHDLGAGSLPRDGGVGDEDHVAAPRVDLLAEGRVVVVVVVGVQAVRLAEALRHRGRHARPAAVGEPEVLGLVQVAEHVDVEERGVVHGARRGGEGAEEAHHVLDVGARHARGPHERRAAQLEVHDLVDAAPSSGALTILSNRSSPRARRRAWRTRAPPSCSARTSPRCMTAASA